MDQCCTLNAEKHLILGYFPIRGKGQVPRMLCEYLHLPYKDILFTPQCWEEFKKTQTINWTFEELPFLKDKDFVVTETYPICLYLINKSGKKDLLGKTLADEIKVDVFLFKTQVTSLVLSRIVKIKQLPEEQQRSKFETVFKENFKQKIIELEKKCCDNFYLGYLSIIDFYIYELINLLNIVFKQQVEQFPRLVNVYRNVGSIPEVKAYQSSSRAVKNVCPLDFCCKWKKKCSTEQCI